MSNYRADCSRCCALCCVAPCQLREQGFPVDKPANAACQHLNIGHRCAIYATRNREGYSACESFDCFGAGQWITQSLFGGAEWTDSPGLANRMFAAYRHWVPRFEAAALIEAALPFVRGDARCALTELMMKLTSGEAAADPEFADPTALRQATLAAIREALGGDRRGAHAVDR